MYNLDPCNEMSIQIEGWVLNGTDMKETSLINAICGKVVSYPRKDAINLVLN